jgi:hypothetical protein
MQVQNQHTSQTDRTLIEKAINEEEKKYQVALKEDVPFEILKSFKQRLRQLRVQLSKYVQQ